MKKKLIIGGAITLLILAVCGYGVSRFIDKKFTPAQVKMPTVKVEKGDVEKVVFAEGVVAEAEREEIKPEVRSKVTQVLVNEGDVVKAGDLLYTMDEGDSKLALRLEEMNYALKARELDKAAQAADTDLVRSHLGGKVVKVMVREGDKVEENTIIAKITDPGVMEAAAPFNSTDVGKIKVGQKSRVFLFDSLAYLDGTVIKVDKKGLADPSGGMIHNVTVRFNNPGTVLVESTAYIEVLFAEGQAVKSIESGKVSISEVTGIKAGAAGTVLELKIREEENIAKGQIIAKLDISDSRMALQDRRLALTQAELSREMKRNEMEKYYIYAGQDGIIGEVNVVAGKEPPTDKPAIVISNTKGLELVSKVEEEDIPFIRVGQEATVYIKSFGDRKFPGVISAISTQGKTEGNTVVFETKIKIKDPGLIKVGMTGDADILIEKKKDVLRLPLSSVLVEGRKGTVMLPGAESNPPKAKEVRVGLEGDEYVEITGGLKQGEEVLMNPNKPQQTMGY